MDIGAPIAATQRTADPYRIWTKFSSLQADNAAQPSRGGQMLDLKGPRLRHHPFDSVGGSYTAPALFSPAGAMATARRSYWRNFQCGERFDTAWGPRHRICSAS